MARDLSDNEIAEIRSLLTGGDKIAAVKLYRELTEAGLAEAKSAVEAIEVGRAIPGRSLADASNANIADIQAAIFAGNKIQAIKLYRAAIGAGLKESKEFIEALEVELRQTTPEKFTAPTAKGCGAAVLAVLAVSLSAVICGIDVSRQSSFAAKRFSIHDQPASASSRFLPLNRGLTPDGE